MVTFNSYVSLPEGKTIGFLVAQSGLPMLAVVARKSTAIVANLLLLLSSYESGATIDPMQRTKNGCVSHKKKHFYTSTEPLDSLDIMGKMVNKNCFSQ